MDLGPFIELQGFPENEYGELVIVKKLVGNHVKQLLERIPVIDKLILTRSEGDGLIRIDGVLRYGSKELAAHGTHANLFFALDACLKSLKKEVG